MRYEKPVAIGADYREFVYSNSSYLSVGPNCSSGCSNGCASSGGGGGGGGGCGGISRNFIALEKIRQRALQI